MPRRTERTCHSVITCAACGYRGSDAAWPTIFCARCAEPNVTLYQRDHVDRERATGMTMADVRAEYREAGLPFAPMRDLPAYQHRREA